MADQKPLQEEEMDFQVVHSRKRSRRLSTSSNCSSVSGESLPSERPPKAVTPPPIVMDNPPNWQDLAELLISLLKFRPKFIWRGRRLRMHCLTVDDFRSAQNLLQARKVGFHTFSLPADRPLKVVMRGLPYDTPVEDINNELLSQGFTPEHVQPLLNRDKKPMNCFLIKLRRVEGFDRIYKLTEFFYASVTVVKFNQRLGPTQCFHCQRLGHSSYYCRMAPRCVRCGEQHDKGSCLKKPEDAPKCANCSQGHTANYRGCQCFKDSAKYMAPRRTTAPVSRRSAPPKPYSEAPRPTRAPASSPAPAAVTEPTPPPTKQRPAKFQKTDHQPPKARQPREYKPVSYAQVITPRDETPTPALQPAPSVAEPAASSSQTSPDFNLDLGEKDGIISLKQESFNKWLRDVLLLIMGCTTKKDLVAGILGSVAVLFSDD